MDKHKAIYKLYPSVTVIRGDVAYDKDEQEVTYDNNVVEALMAAEEYKEQRAKEYPPLTEQLDYIYHNGIEAWKTDMINPVKTKYPKGSV
tara:strand:- start:776 stop:1045 length:270 start_codon:yes stop_codon:yes gene_type:complete